MSRYTTDDVYRALVVVTADREDFVYRREFGVFHRYVHGRGTPDARPGNIVGHVVHALTGGLVPEEWEMRPADNYLSAEVFTPEARDLLTFISRLQDLGYPWGVIFLATRTLVRHSSRRIA